MVSDSTALVLFAIRSSLKLGQQIRQAYVDATKRRKLVLPLPDFYSTPDIVSAVNYFAGTGNQYIRPGTLLNRLFQKWKTPGEELTEEEKGLLVDYHHEFFNLDLINAGRLGPVPSGESLDAAEFTALITIRQWERGEDPNPSTLQRMAGTFVEIGIDYFSSVPGALNKDSREGKVLAGFLDGMSSIDFKEEELGAIPGRLMVAALETVSENSELLSADLKVQELVRVTTAALSKDVAVRLNRIGDDNLVKKEKVADWAELVFRSLLSSAGGLVLSDPERYLGVENDAHAALVSNVGESVLSLILDEEDLGLDRLFSRDGLETVMQSALAVLGEHPEIVTDSNNEGLKKLIASVARELSEYDTLLTPDMLPELTRMILDKTGDHLELLWPELATRPEKHLLLTAAKTTLEIISEKPADGQQWKLRFTSSDSLLVVNAVMDEVIENPNWLLEDAGAVSDHLKGAVEAAIQALRRHADNRLSSETAADIVQSVVLACSRRLEFFEKIPAGGQSLITTALELMLGKLFDTDLDQKAAWQLVRRDTVGLIVEISLKQLSESKLNEAKVMKLGELIDEQIAALSNGEALNLDAFEETLALELAA